jgi:hypothetical protein
MRRSAGCLLPLLALAGCASPTPSGTDAYLEKAKTFGVVSLIGDSFHESRMGMTVFGNSGFSAPVPDWHVEEFAAQRTLALLRSHGRFQAVALERSGISSDELLRDDRRQLWDLAQRQGVDALVAIVPKAMLVAPHIGIGPGYGIFDKDSPKGPSHCVYFLVEIELLDVALHQRKAGQAIHADCHGSDQLGDEEIAFRDSFDGYTDAEKWQIRHLLETRIASSVREALAALHLL